MESTAAPAGGRGEDPAPATSSEGPAPAADGSPAGTEGSGGEAPDRAELLETKLDRLISLVSDQVSRRSPEAASGETTEFSPELGQRIAREVVTRLRGVLPPAPSTGDDSTPAREAAPESSGLEKISLDDIGAMIDHLTRPT